MRRALAVVAVLLLASTASADAEFEAQVRRVADGMAGDFTFIGLSHAADLGTTAWALEACPTCRESNPLGTSVEARVALKSAGFAAIIGINYALRRGGHHKAANIIRWSIVALNVGFAVNNARHALRGQ